MFDEIECRYPLPIPGANDLLYQTKDTASQWMELYEIGEDGILRYDNSEEKRWEQINETGEIVFYAMYAFDGDKIVNATHVNTAGYVKAGWLEWSAYFVDGKLNQINLIENREPQQQTSQQG